MYIVYIYIHISIYMCVIFVLPVGCSVIVGHCDKLPCAASLKSLQGIEVHFHFVDFQ